MKFQFKIQQYQTDAVNAIVKVFAGQPYLDKVKYTRDFGLVEKSSQTSIFTMPNAGYEAEDVGFENAKIVLDDEQLLKNINGLQLANNIKLSSGLVHNMGRCSLDIEMETGTGKTYVYIKSIFELNKLYGFSKFMIVVPSIAIREGVKKSFEITQEHFMDDYGKKIRFFIYNSSRLSEIDSFSSSNAISVMIINAQAFNATGKDARRIDMKLDEFQSRKPIDVIAKNRPIIILDEPQKLGGEKTQARLKDFNPLFLLNFSATHVKQNNLIYVLDALEAYNQKLVKKIEVKGFEVKNLRGTGKYLYLSGIVLAKNKPPMARIEFEHNYNNSINRDAKLCKVEDNLYNLSAGVNMPPLEQYKNGYIVSEINPFNNTVTFLNGEVLMVGEAKGDFSERDMRRIQIRETIISHFEKESKNFNKEIKTLSLFFIDEVAKYRKYDESGQEINGDYADIFEREYKSVLNEYLSIIETPYVKYLKSIDVHKTHNGYFAIDKANRLADPSVGKRGEGISDDISAYDLILKDKEKLLSFEEPTRFIFSHSALREGWDNPNVFQICALKHSDSTVTKRQEVGRGMRICVDCDGERMDKEKMGKDVHSLNKLTVIASDSYASFVTGLQAEISAELYDRPTKASKEYFIGKIVADNNGLAIEIDSAMASKIIRYLIVNGYTDEDDHVTDKYRQDLASERLVALPETLQAIASGVHKLVQSVFDENVLKNMFDNANTAKIMGNDLNENFYKKEFQKLWEQINHKYTYMVDFNSDELIGKAIKHIQEKIYVSEVKYVRTIGEQKTLMDENDLSRGEAFKGAKTETSTLKSLGESDIEYDLVGMIAIGATLTRKTVVKILKGLQERTFAMFKANPEEFISKCIKLINEQKATMIVDEIAYNQIEGSYSSDIFTADKSGAEFEKAFKAEKHIQDYVFTDGIAPKSVERRFAEELDGAKEVCVYAKLPRTFQIPTPVGNYTPDWAIAFNDNSGIKHIYFVAETKGTMESLELRPIEQAKIKCAKKLFNELSSSKVRYHDVTSYGDLLNVMKSIN